LARSRQDDVLGWRLDRWHDRGWDWCCDRRRGHGGRWRWPPLRRGARYASGSSSHGASSP
jgi:hypothetical protein